MTISEQEIEMERMKTTIVALNGKCAIVDYMKNDFDKNYYNDPNT